MLNRQADQGHEQAGRSGQPAQNAGGRHMAIGHRTEHERGDEACERIGGESIRLDSPQPVGIQDRPQRHKINGHAR